MFEVPVSGYPVEAEEASTLTRELLQANDADFRLVQDNAEANLELVKKLRKVRENRDTFLGAGLFFDPAWDILLTLYVSKVQQIRLKRGSVIEESGVPATTVFRWINVLSERGFIVTTNNPTDARSSLVELTDLAAAKMTRYLNYFCSELSEI